jgi:RNA polymerase sigma factor (TIGR02999 family)
MSDRGTVTRLLAAHSDGDPDAFDALMPIVYRELRTIAHRHLRKERPGHTLDTAGLVHETYMKLVDYNRIQYRSRGHFYAIAAQAMRQILVNWAHRRNAEKRGGGRVVESIDDTRPAADPRVTKLLDLDDALHRLARLHRRQSRVVECRFFAGLTVAETAEALDVSTATVKRDWAAARAWLNRALREDSHRSAAGDRVSAADA